MEQITTKKQLLAALSDWAPSIFDKDGIPANTSLFNSIDSDRGYQINENIGDNVKEAIANSEMKKGVSVQDFIKICARNIELNSDEELLHFMFQCGNIYAELAYRTQRLKPPIIGGN